MARFLKGIEQRLPGDAARADVVKIGPFHKVLSNANRGGFVNNARWATKDDEEIRNPLENAHFNPYVAFADGGQSSDTRPEVKIQWCFCVIRVLQVGREPIRKVPFVTLPSRRQWVVGK